MILISSIPWIAYIAYFKNIKKSKPWVWSSAIKKGAGSQVFRGD